MKTNSFARFFARLGLNRQARRAANTFRSLSRPRLEALEDRTLLSVLPPPVLGTPQNLTGNISGGTGAQVIFDPLNHLKLVEVNTEGPANTKLPNNPTATTGGRFSIDGGRSWNDLTFNSTLDDPTILKPPGTHPFAAVSSPSIAFDGLENFYVIRTEHSADFKSGEVVLDKYLFNQDAPTAVFQDRVLYEWVNQDPAYNPVVAVDTNQPNFTDPQVSTATQTDTLANTIDRGDVGAGTVPKVVYVAWNTNFTQPNGSTPALVSQIVVEGSDDGGQTFTTQQQVSSSPGAAPQIVFTQGSADGAIAGGQVGFIWNGGEFVNGAVVYDQIDVAFSQPDGASATTGAVSSQAFVGLGGDLNPASTNPKAVGVSTFSIPVTITDPKFDSLTDLSVALNLADPKVGNLLIELLPSANVVAATGISSITLVNNAFDLNGASTTLGLPSAVGLGLPQYTPGPANFSFTAGGATQYDSATGTTKDQTGGAIFDAFAPRFITDVTTANPHVGYYSPEDFFQSLLTLDNKGLTAADLQGAWTLKITDFGVAGSAPELLVNWSLNFNSRISTSGLGTTTTLAAAPVRGSFNNSYPLVTGASGPNGIGPGIVAAVDNTLGAFSPYQGRLYIAYTSGGGSDTNISLVHSDDSGATWSDPVIVNDDSSNDNFSEGNRPQFEPSLAVDPLTGSVVVSYYDGRFDASLTRVANAFQASTDGGDTFTPAVFLNVPKTAVDAVTGNVQFIEPIPGNESLSANNAGFGDRAGLVIYGGQVTAVFATNLNSGYNIALGDTGNPQLGTTGAAIFSTNVAIAAGPRVVRGDSGPVNQGSFAADGTPQLTSFVIAFDRPVNPATFFDSLGNVTGVTVQYKSPTGQTSAVAIQTVTPLDGNTLFGPRQVGGNNSLATTFLVQLAQAQSLVGTYSYSVGPLISDRIRTVGINVTPIAPTPPFDKPFVATDVGQMVGDPPLPPVATSSLVVPALPAGQVIDKVTVNLSIQHTYDSDLILTLISPGGVRVRLSNRNGGSGDNFTNTTFDDDATVPIGDGSPPFTGSFQPDEPLSILFGTDAVGTWKLELDDHIPLDSGTLLGWSLTIKPGLVSSSVTLGNSMDQNANGIAGEPTVDVFANPTPVNGVPFQAPYQQDTLPFIIPGPHVVGTTVVGNNSGQDANLVLNKTTNGIQVTFDRDINASSFTPASVVSMIGPAGRIGGPFTVTPVGAAAADGGYRTFLVGFPVQTLSGSYNIVLASTITDTQGHALDTNLNAGLDVLRGTTNSTGSNTVQTFTTGNIGAAIPAGKSIVVPLLIGDAFPITQDAVNHIQLQLNISYPNDPDLTVQLVVPDGPNGTDGTVIQLFTAVGKFAKPPLADFKDTIFDDFATTPIQSAGPPFQGGPFTPQIPLSKLIGKGSAGTWKLVITNSGSQTGALNYWTLKLPQAVPGSGLGEPTADQATVHFRIFTQAPTNVQSSKQWTAVGPASENGGSNSARIGGLALDPSDPSGNTVYAAGASGGVWKTTNFLTTDGSGPTWIPLTDLGPSFSLNIGGLAVFGRNNDPNQSAIFAATGEGDTGSPGVGLLRSLDGGRTWKVLDSTNNVDGQGNVLPLASTMRDHKFAGLTAFKVLVDPTPLTNGQIAVYVAFSGGNGGVWRSVDGGNTWNLIRAGNATDIALAPGSHDSHGNLTLLYAGFRGEGVFLTTSAPNAASMTALNGGQGDPLRRDIDNTPDVTIPVAAPSSIPQGAHSRIVLTTPALTNDPVRDLFYQGWVYAAVSNGGNLLGVYLTKDFGANWTKVRLPVYVPLDPVTGKPSTSVAYASNNTTRPDFDPTSQPQGTPLFSQADYDLSLAVDPNNPNVVYLGGTNDGAQSPLGGEIRIDVSNLIDPYALIPWNNSLTTGGAQVASTGGVVIKKPAKEFGIADNLDQAYFNLYRDPINPFLAPSSLPFNNIASFTNTGTGARYQGFNDILAGSTDQHRILTFKDPLTGLTRLILGDDQGIITGVDRGDGTLITQVGSATLPTGHRNGNLQIIQFYQSAGQPSQLAADISGALFYGEAQDDGFPASSKDILKTGDLNWNGSTGDGTGVATDQTGSGTLYEYHWPCCGAGPLPSDFFLVTLQPGGTQTSRTQGLLQNGDDPSNNKGQWPFVAGFRFTVNPIDSTAIVISSAAGRVFRTNGPLTGTGVQWFVIGDPGDLDSTHAGALAFGAPEVNAAPDQLSDFIYAGTDGGKIFVTFNGGGFNGSTKWKNISAGLDGSSVQKIVADPKRGTHDAFAVTLSGVYYMPDSTATAPQWIKLNDTTGQGTLFNLTRPVFNDSNDPFPALKYLTSLAVDWRFAIPDATGGGTHPVLYVGGEGGVYRSFDKGLTWTVFPNKNVDGAPQDGGFLPNAHITDLALLLGNVDPKTGFADPAAGFNLLLATTYGRGDFAIRLDNHLFQQFTAAPNSGPRVQSIAPVTTSDGTALTGIIVTLADTIDPETFTAAVINQLTDPSNNAIGIGSIFDISTPPPGKANPHNTFEILFASPQTTKGIYTLSIGPNLLDYSGNAMDQNQNNINGEVPDDIFTGTIQFPPLAITGLPAQVTLLEPGQTSTALNFQVADSVAGADAVMLSASADNSTLLPNTSLTFSGSGTDRTLTITPASGELGATTVTVHASDPQGLSTQESFQVLVGLGVSINGTMPGDGVTLGTYTQLVVNGSVTLGGVPLQISHLAITNSGQAFTVLHSTGGVSGTFGGLSQGATVTAPDGTKFTISYQANSGKDVVLTQTNPTPTATKLVVTTQPPTAVVTGSPFGLAITVEDGEGNISTTYNGTVALALAANPGGSTLGGMLMVTAVNGVATFTGLTLDKVGKGYTLQATATGLTPATTDPFDVTVVATKLAVTVQPPSSVTAGDLFGFTVTAEDSAGQLAAGFNGSVTVALANNPGGSTLGGTLMVTAVNGVATFTGLTLDQLGTGYTLQVTAAGLNPAVTSPFDVTPVATQLVVTVQPPNLVIATQGFDFSVSAEDSAGQLAAGYNGVVTVALANNPGGSTLGGNIMVTAVNGVATFTGLTLDKAASGYTLQVSSGALAGATTTTFDVTVKATQLVVTVPPPAALVEGTGFAFTVTAEDNAGIVALGYSGVVSVALAANPGGSTLGGTLMVTAVNGVATFTGLTLDKVGKGYTLQATAAGLAPATTIPFNVIHPISDLTLPHNQFPLQVSVDTSGSPFSPVATVGGDSPLYDLEQKLGLRRFGPTYFTGEGGHNAKWLYSDTVLNQYGQPWYTLLPDGTLHAWDGSADSATGAVVATVDRVVYFDPTLLINAQPPVDYTQLLTVETQLGLRQFNGTYFTGALGHNAKWLYSDTVLNQYGQPWYTLLPDGTLRGWTGSADPDNGSILGAILAHLDPTIYVNPTLLLNAKASADSYPHLYAVEQQFDLRQFGGTYYTGQLGGGAQWLYSDVPNQYGQPWYNLLPGGSLRAWDGSDDVFSGAVVATVDPNAYSDPTLLTNAKALPNPAVALTFTGSILTIAPPADFVGTFSLTITKFVGSQPNSQSYQITVTDNAPTLQPIGDQSLSHRSFPTSATVGVSDPDGDLVSLQTTVFSSSPLYDLQRQYGLRQFGGTYYLGAGGHSAKWLYGAPNQYGQPWYNLLPDGTLHAWDGSADSATGVVVATVDPKVYIDPTLLTKAAPPVNYSQLNDLETQLGLHQQGGTYYTGQLGGQAKWLYGVTNQYGQPWYTLLPDGTLHAWTGSTDPLIGSFAGVVVAKLDPSIYVNPTLLTSAKAPQALYLQLVPVEQQFDLRQFGRTYFDGAGGHNAKWLYSDVPNQYGQPWYTLLPDGTLHAWDGSADSASGAVVATVDASIYVDPSLLTNARSSLDGTSVTALLTGNTISIGAPISFVGAVRITVTASDGVLSSSQNFRIISTDTAPQPTPIPDQTVSHTLGMLQGALSATDAENDPVSFSATAAGYSPLYNLEQLLRLKPADPQYAFGVYGGLAKWLVSDGVQNQYGNYFYTLLPDGTLHAWDGSRDPKTGSSSGAVVATVGTAVYDDPTLLTKAQAPAAPNVNVNVSGNVLTLTFLGGYTGTFQVFVTAFDGALSTRSSFLVTVT